MFCPVCRSEYVPQVTTCVHCATALVESLPDEDVFASAEAMARSLADKEIEAVLTGSHVALSKAQEDLARRRIASVIAGEPETTLEAGVHPRFYLMVAATDLEAARELFHTQWKGELSKEGLLVEPTSTADASTERCPACGAVVPEPAAECPDCGLFLGDPGQAE